MPGSAEPVSPATTLEEALALLRRPPAPPAVRFKALIDAGDRCQVVAYTDVRFVIDQLNAVCGGRWQATYKPLEEALRPTVAEHDADRMLYVRCALRVFDVTRSDVGEARDGTRFGAGPKAAWSDALKRAAVHFGVNQAIYALRAPWLPVHARDGACPPGHVARSARGGLYVPQPTLTRLRDLYAAWLQDRGRAFGAPIDFGEEDAAVGVEGDPDRPPDPAGAPAPDGQPARTAGRVVAIGAAHAERPAAYTDPPASPQTRGELRALADKAGLDDRFLRALADVLFGEALIDRLPEARLRELRAVLETALATRRAGGELRAALTAAGSAGDRAAARGAFLAWLAAPARRTA